MLNQNFIIIGTLIGAVGSLAYLVDTVKGKVKPNRVSFLLWSIAPFIAFAAQIKQGVGLESLMTFSTGFLPLTTFIASFVNKKAEWKITKFDLVCGVLSILGLILWLVTKVGNIAITFSILADALAAIPTIVKAYKYPDTEIAWPWIATVFGVVLTLLTLNELTFANSGFIIYILIVNTLIFSLVQFRIGEELGSKKHESQ
jgi:predicted CDP-diglyceride synthetase/phosphatidate cytidylyltransferase